MKFGIVTYSNEKYKFKQDRLKSLTNTMFGDSVPFFGYTDTWLKETSFYKENKVILDCERGAGYWLWKPYVILNAMETHRLDAVFYLDCGDYFSKGVLDYVKPILEKEDCLLLGGSYPHCEWTKMDCFILMGCNNPTYMDYSVLQLEAGIQFWKNTQKSIDVLKEQILWGSDRRIITDIPNSCYEGNPPNFKDHRHDQSILTNLAIKHKLPVDSRFYNSPYSGLRQYVTCNVEY